MIDSQDLREAYIFASVPSFMYRRFSENPEIIRLKNEWKIDQLIDYFIECYEYIGDDKDGFNNEITCFAIFIAATLKDEADEFFNVVNYDNFALRWLNKFEEYYQQRKGNNK